MNENDLLHETQVGNYRITTYDDGIMYQTDVTVESSPPTEYPWNMARCFTPEEAAEQHQRIVQEITDGMVPGHEG